MLNIYFLFNGEWFGVYLILNRLTRALNDVRSFLYGVYARSPPINSIRINLKNVHHLINSLVKGLRQKHHKDDGIHQQHDNAVL